MSGSGSINTNQAAARPTGAPPAAAPPAPKKESRGLFGHIADVFVGGGEALWDVGKGLVTMVTHPIQTVKGIGYAVTHPAALYHAFVDPYTEAIAEGRPGKAIGRGIVEIGSLFITGGSSGAVSGGAKGASAAAKLGQAAKVAGKAGKAGKAGELAAVVAKAGQASKASKLAGIFTRVGSKPVFTKAAQLAAKEAGITEKVAKAALKAAHASYWEARAAGKTAAVAKAAAAAKAAKVMGLSKNAAVVQKVVNGARLSGAAAQSAKLASKVPLVRRISLAAASAKGLPSKAVSSLRGAGKVASSKIGSTAQKIGAITVKDIVMAPITVPRAMLGGARRLIGDAWSKLPSKTAVAKAGKAGLRATPGVLKSGATTAGKLIKGAVTLPFKVARGAMSKGWQAGKYLATHPRTWTPIAVAGRTAIEGIRGLSDPANLPDDQIAAIAQQFKLKPTRENVAAFIKELQGYQGSAIGPDSGSPEEVQQLQTVLKALGYDVEPSGTFDEKTAAAVIDFKGQSGITQSYQLEDGTPAVNEYVDERTAQAMVAALNAGGTAAPAGEAQAGPAADAGAEAATPASPTAGPANRTYTVGQMDRATGLSGIARHYLGDAGRWKEIYELNKELIGDNPNFIVAGQKLRMPADAKGLPVDKAPAPSPAQGPGSPPDAAAGKKYDFSPAQAQELADKYGLQPGLDNVQAFVDEVNSYRDTAIGPDSGDADAVSKLQQVLIALGHADVKDTGKFDDATGNAVMAFKQKNGLHQRYKLSGGDWAINEYVDEATARAMADAVGK